MTSLLKMESIERKSLLYKSKVEYADFCLNHVEGCSHGCKYPCYAYMMKKRCGIIKTYEDWCRPKIVSNALIGKRGQLVFTENQYCNVLLNAIL